MALGCHATASTSARHLDMPGGDEQDDGFKRPTQPLSSKEMSLGEGPPPLVEYSLLGARADLALAPDAADKSTCSCLAAVAGPASSGAFLWEKAYPKTNPSIQVVMAFTSQTEDCPAAPAGALGASYWGYELSGDDVVVVVENAVPGPPIITGAILPKPLEGGRVLVRPKDASVPYGRPLDSGKACVIAVQTKDVIPKPSKSKHPEPKPRPSKAGPKTPTSAPEPASD